MKIASAAAATLLCLTLVGCSDAEDLVRDKASDAACSVAQQAMDAVGDQARQAIDDIKADPQGAEERLKALRDSLVALEGQVDGRTGGKVTQAREALDRLVEEADAARTGTPVDDQAVAEARTELDTAIEDFRTLC